MTLGEIVDRIRELVGPSLTNAQIIQVINEVARSTGSSATIKYEECSHTSTDMLEDYARHGVCSICVHEKNKRLMALIKNPSSGSSAVGGLAAQAMNKRFLRVVELFGTCKRCGVDLLQPKKRGCVECRETRGWLSRMTRDKKPREERKPNG